MCGVIGAMNGMLIDLWHKDDCVSQARENGFDRSIHAVFFTPVEMIRFGGRRSSNLMFSGCAAGSRLRVHRQLSRCVHRFQNSTDTGFFHVSGKPLRDIQY